MVETCVNTLRQTTQNYSTAVLTSLFHATSPSVDEDCNNDNAKTRKVKVEVQAVAVIDKTPQPKMDPAKLQAMLLEQKSNWFKAGNCQ